MTAPGDPDNRILAALADLAEHGGPDDIAAYLLEEGHRGLVDSPSACPVTHYLADYCDLDADALAVQLCTWSYARAEGALPGPVAGFVAHFDDRRYPALIVAAPDGYRAGWAAATADLNPGLESA